MRDLPTQDRLRWIVAGLLVLGPLLAVLAVTRSATPTRVQMGREPIEISIKIQEPKPAELVRPELAKFEPETGCYLGAYIDLADELKQVYRDNTGKPRKMPREFEAIVGKPHAIYFFYLGYGEPIPVDYLRKLTAERKYVHIALEPNSGLERVQDDDYLRGIADQIRDSGARVFLRFASEMNGPWVKYHGDPELYIEKWRLITEVMRDRAPNVAMVWCPYATPEGNRDDYYPGDEWVDWVGVNFYSVTYFNQNRNTPAFHIKPSDFLDSIYEKYAERKPIMIGEYGTTHFSRLENKNFRAFAINNIQTLFRDLKRRFPRVKAINYFNVNNLRLEHRQNNNYSVTHDMEVLQAYRQATKDPYFLSQPSDESPSGPGDRVISLEPHAVIQGRTRLLFWVFPPKEANMLRLSLSGKQLETMIGVENWQAVLNTETLPEGKQTLRLDVIDNSGRTVEKKEIPVEIRR